MSRWTVAAASSRQSAVRKQAVPERARHHARGPEKSADLRKLGFSGEPITLSSTRAFRPPLTHPHEERLMSGTRSTSSSPAVAHGQHGSHSRHSRHSRHNRHSYRSHSTLPRWAMLGASLAVLIGTLLLAPDGLAAQEAQAQRLLDWSHLEMWVRGLVGEYILHIATIVCLLIWIVVRAIRGQADSRVTLLLLLFIAGIALAMAGG